MIPAEFEYHAPASVSEALQLLTSLPDARLLAGGHSLLPLMKLRLVTPAHLIDLGGIDGLRGVTDGGPILTIGALTSHWTIEASPEVRARVPILADTAGSIGDVQVRNFGTIGGSLAHGDPAADYPATLLALESEIVAEGLRGRRTIQAEEFFTGVFRTALHPEEILVEVRVPVPPVGAGSAYLSFPHPASGFAVVGVAAVITLDPKGACRRARIGVTGVGPAPYRAKAVESLLTGKPLTDELIAAASEHAADGIEVNADLFASAQYRGHLAGVYTKRAVHAALESRQG